VLNKADLLHQRPWSYSDPIMGLNSKYNLKFIWAICLVAALGGLLFGYDWVVIGGAKPFYEAYFNLTSSLQIGWAMSCALVGCMIGSILSGGLSDKFGRKRLLIFSGFLFTLSAIGTGCSESFGVFVIYRLTGGVGIGLASNLSPMYIAEISPAHIRGRFVSINQLTIVIGILAAQVMNFMISQQVPTADQLRLLASSDELVRVVNGSDFDVQQEKDLAAAVTDMEVFKAVRERFPDLAMAAVEEGDKLALEQKEAEDKEIMTAYILPTWNGQHGWRWMFWAETVPACIFFLFMFFVPESPRWLVKNGKDQRAGSILEKVGGAAYAADALADIKDSLKNELGKVHFRELLNPKLLNILLIGVVLAVFQQWCGINVIFNYAHEIFTQAGYGISTMLFNIVITGIVNLAFTFVAIYTVDRWGRRKLMLMGSAGLAVIFSLIGASYFFRVTGIHLLILVIAAIACYACTLAPITWVIISEIFPNRIRGAAMSVSVTMLWIACFVLTSSFPILNSGLGAAGTFWIYAAICVLGFTFIIKRLPETKGKTLEEIEKDLVPFTSHR